MRGADASAGAIKSGGKTRRAAKMVILDVDHPDVEEFIWCKAIEERKARVLEQAGFDMSLDGKDSFSVQYQNANNSVRVTDDFMKAVENDNDWNLKSVQDKRVVKTVRARELMRQFAEAAWECADPGMQYDTTINRWHTAPNAGRINASNPCSEYMHLDNSACNLASINLLKYLNEDGSFAINEFKHTVELVFMAQEILVGYSSYPTKNITKNAKAYRELGLGYANLGAMLMAQGLPYDSDEGRAQAAAVTALMTGHAYATSAKMAKKVGPFAGYHKDREGMNKVLKMHRDEVNKIDASLVSEELLSAAATAWDEAVELADIHGVRNSQASVLAPTGTIGLMMDCDTTGIEPDLGLTKVKKLVGGGTMFIVNQTVPRALRNLGYSQSQIDDIVKYIDDEKTIIGAPHLKDDHLNVFACSMGDNAIHYLGHVKMMAAVQPFISGAISKTVNMPEDVSVEDVEQLHIDAWKMGLKAVAIYRDNCKVAQPLSMAKKEEKKEETPVSVASVLAESPAQTLVAAAENLMPRGATRRELPRIRSSKTFKFTIADSRCYMTVGEFEDGTPGELFVSIAKMGSTLRGVMDSFAVSVSYGLQFGVPLKQYVRNFTSTSFAPAGVTDDPDIRTASSIIDYIFRRLGKTYLSFDDQLEVGLASIEDMPVDQTSLLNDQATKEEVEQLQETMQESIIASEVPVEVVSASTASIPQASQPAQQPQAPAVQPKSSFKTDDAPLCFNCGNQTQRAGSCYVCTSCGSTTGCS
jgi:ribonucleoside-diphosphate reductase alpha chain